MTTCCASQLRRMCRSAKKWRSTARDTRQGGAPERRSAGAPERRATHGGMGMQGCRDEVAFCFKAKSSSGEATF